MAGERPARLIRTRREDSGGNIHTAFLLKVRHGPERAFSFYRVAKDSCEDSSALSLAGFLHKAANAGRKPANDEAANAA